MSSKSTLEVVLEGLNQRFINIRRGDFYLIIGMHKCFFISPIAEQSPFLNFGCSLGANSIDTMDIIDSMDKTAYFYETGWTQWTLEYDIDSSVQ